MAEYIEREALLVAYDEAHKGPPGGARKLIEEAPAVKIMFVCDRRVCSKCMPLKSGCRHTSDIRHAKNFELRGDAFKELERSDE